MSAGMAHQPAVTVEASNVGARWRMRCPACQAQTPPMSQAGAQLAADRHAWETEPSASSGGAVSSSGRRRGRTV
jgi:hypothetical protein